MYEGVHASVCKLWVEGSGQLWVSFSIMSYLGFEADFLWYLELPDLVRLSGQSDVISLPPLHEDYRHGP